MVRRVAGSQKLSYIRAVRMMYCPRCNNTFWKTSERKTVMDYFSVLWFRRPYRCTKCDRIKHASIFLAWSDAPKRKKIDFSKESTSQLNCPECGGILRRSHRNLLERLFFVFRAYRCIDCRARFRSLRFG